VAGGGQPAACGCGRHGRCPSLPRRRSSNSDGESSVGRAVQAARAASRGRRPSLPRSRPGQRRPFYSLLTPTAILFVNNSNSWPALGRRGGREVPGGRGRRPS
jgi:hypothetical protein